MNNENLYTPDCIRTFTGKYVNVFDPDPETICIEDISEGTSLSSFQSLNIALIVL